MKILTLEFSSSQRSVAVVQPSGGPGPSFQSEVIEAGGRSTRAFGMIERALSQAMLEREDVECLAVGLGPGSYTGIRAAIALAQGWQLARDIKLLGIGTIETLAAQAQGEGWRGRVDFVVDAQRGEFYHAAWQLSDVRRVETQPLRITSRDSINRLLTEGGTVLGPDLHRHFPSAKELYPGALALGRLALARADFVPGNALAPVYLRDTAFVKAPPPRVI